MLSAIRTLSLTGIVIVFFVLLGSNAYGFSDAVERVGAVAVVLYFACSFILWGRQLLEAFLEWFGF